MASDLPPNRPSFTCGLLIGCSPLILLFFLFIGLFAWSAMDHGTREVIEPPAPALPRIDSSTLVADLLPTPPKASKNPVYLGDDLSHVPELMLEAATTATTDEWVNRKAHAAAAALYLNGKEEDGYLKALLRTRPDLAGLPFTMGDACRTKGAQAKAFKEAAEAVRNKKGSAILDKAPDTDAGEERRQKFYQAHLAVVTQVIPVEEPSDQHSLIRALSSIPRPEATSALGRLAVFSTDEAVRSAAIEALAIRREGDVTDTLVAGLRYPWPPAAENAAKAIVKLKRKDLLPQLEIMFDGPDPRGPRTEVIDGRKETVAHELVRVNHLRNCLLCHAPAERGKMLDQTLVAEVPVPTMSLPDSRDGYGQSESTLLVRIDVTYLRQDFSAMQEVKDWTVNSWPTSQRFDFLIRKRVLTPAEVDDLRVRLAGVSPYRRAAELAMHELTGRDFAAKVGK